MMLTITPRCDICGEPDGPGVPDWNGETGNHVSCEAADEPCRCGHPQSAHTELGCGAPTNYGGGWAIDSPCTCGFYQIEDDPNA